MFLAPQQGLCQKLKPLRLYIRRLLGHPHNHFHYKKLYSQTLHFPQQPKAQACQFCWSRRGVLMQGRDGTLCSPQRSWERTWKSRADESLACRGVTSDFLPSHHSQRQPQEGPNVQGNVHSRLPPSFLHYALFCSNENAELLLETLRYRESNLSFS